MAENPSKVLFGKTLYECRTQAKSRLTQSELGAALGKSGDLISKIENGKYLPNINQLEKIITKLESRDVPEEMLEKLRELHPLSDLADKHPSLRSSGDQNLTRSIKRLYNDGEKEQTDREEFLWDIEWIVTCWRELWESEKKKEKGKLQDAREDLKDILGKMDNIGEGLRVRSLQNIGVLYRYEGNTPAAQNYLTAALDIANKRVDNLKKAEIHVQLGDIYRRSGDWSQAKDNYQQSLDIYQERDDEKNIARLLRKITGLMLFQGRHKEALEKIDESIEICRNFRDQSAFWKARRLQAWAYAMMGRLDESIRIHVEANRIIEELGLHDREIAKGLRYLADSYRMAKRTLEAEREYRNALERLEKAFSKQELEKEKLIHGAIYHGLGSNYLELSKFGEASIFLEKSLSLSMEANDRFRMGLDLNQLGRLHTSLFDYQKAVDEFGHALELFDQPDGPNNLYYLASVHLNIARLKYRMKEYPEAMDHAEKAIMISEDHAFHVHLSRAHMLIAEVLLMEQGEMKDDVIEHILFSLESAVALNEAMVDEIFKQIYAMIEKNIMEEKIVEALKLGESIDGRLQQKYRQERIHVPAPLKKGLDDLQLRIDPLRILQKENGS